MSGIWAGTIDGAPVAFRLRQDVNKIEGEWVATGFQGEGRLEPNSSFIEERGAILMRIEHSYFIDAAVRGRWKAQEPVLLEP